MDKSVEPAKTILLPYLQRADELQKHDPLVAYYCRLYAMERGLKYPAKERSKTMTAILVSLMNQLERDKKTIPLSPDDNLHVEGFALSVFSKADKQDRAGRADLNTAKTFYASSIFFEILSQFGELDPEIEQKQKYAVWKAADIRKALSEGRTPEPGPPGGDDAGFSLDNVEEHEHEPVHTASAGAPHKYDDPPHKYDDAPHKDDDPPHKYDDAPHKYDDPPHKYDDAPHKYDDAPHKYEDSSLQNPYYTPTAPPPDNIPSATPDTKFPHTTEHFVQPDHNESNQGSNYPSAATPFYFTDSYSSSVNPSLNPYSSSPSPYNPPASTSSPYVQSPSSYPAPTSSPYVQSPSSYPAPTSSPYVQSPSSYPAPYGQGYQAQPAGHTTVKENPISRTTSVPVEQDINYKPPPERVVDAHKSARFAVSALAFDDVPTAISYLKRSLELLTSPHAS